MKEQIINKLKGMKRFKNVDGYGEILNHLQDIVYDNLNDNSIEKYEAKMSIDLARCEGMDGILLNGHYFDWKEADWNKWAHVMAWLEYFNNEDLETILSAC